MGIFFNAVITCQLSVPMESLFHALYIAMETGNSEISAFLCWFTWLACNSMIERDSSIFKRLFFYFFQFFYVAL